MCLKYDMFDENLVSFLDFSQVMIYFIEIIFVSR